MHLILEINALNGKEMPHAGFMKFTGHQFKKMLSVSELRSYAIECHSREYQFLQRDALAVEMYSREVIEQKLDYIHVNPVQGKWNLCSDILEYKFSSASFYESGKNDFGFVKHYMG